MHDILKGDSWSILGFIQISVDEIPVRSVSFGINLCLAFLGRYTVVKISY